MSDLQERRKVRPLALIGMLWIVVLVMSFYGAADIRDEVDKSDALSEQVWLRDLLTSAMKLGDDLGLQKVRDALSEIRGEINDDYTVLVRPAATPVEPPATPEPPPPAVADATDGGTAGAPDRPRHISPRRPRRILVVGASSIQFAIGGELERRLPTYEGVQVKRFGKLATGLSRPDFFDWPKKVDELTRSFRPDLVIANFGGNGAQAIPIGKYDKVAYGTPEWDEVYAQRVTELVDIAAKNGAEVVFMGMPIMRSPKFAAKMRKINEVQLRAARAKGAMFVSTYDMAAKPDGTYRKSIRVGKKRGLMRTSDGVHYTKLGAKFVVDQVLRQVERRYRLVPPQPDRGVAEGHAFVSRVTSSTVSYTAYLPREAAAGAGPRPALLLLGDASQGWDRWSKHPHVELQRLAQAHGMVLVVPDPSADVPWLGGLDPNGHDGLPATVMGELLDDLADHLPITEVRGLAGAGAGGAVASQLGLRYPDRFQSVSVYGGPEVPERGAAFAQAKVAYRYLAEDGPWSKALPDLTAWHAAPAASPDVP